MDKGGCNGMQEGQLTAKRSMEEKSDTVSYSIIGDILKIHVGLNHVCCTPFTTTASIVDSLIRMELTDTCSPPAFNCYCRCRCYYTFDFNFDLGKSKDYKYQIYLKEARVTSPKLMEEGVVFGNKNL